MNKKSEITVVADESTDVVVPPVSLDEYRDLVELEELLRKTVDEWKERLGEVQSELKALVGDAEEATLDGKSVFTYVRINSLREADFRKAYPAMAEVYTDIVEVPKLNINSLRASQPDVYRQFQTRPWKRVK